MSRKVECPIYKNISSNTPFEIIIGDPLDHDTTSYNINSQPDIRNKPPGFSCPLQNAIVQLDSDPSVAVGAGREINCYSCGWHFTITRTR